MQPNNREMVVVKRVWRVFGGSWMLPFSKISGFLILGTNYATISIIFCSLIFHITKSGNRNSKLKLLPDLAHTNLVYTLFYAISYFLCWMALQFKMTKHINKIPKMADYIFLKWLKHDKQPHIFFLKFVFNTSPLEIYSL